MSLNITKQISRFVVILACAVSLSACSVELYSNLDQKQANEIVATLFSHGIPAERVVGRDGKYTVQVDEGRFAEAVSVLNQAGLPRQEFTTLGEVFKNDGIVASPVQERAQMIYALSQELARTVSDIDGVLSARVHLVLPENDPLRQQLIPSSASVFIRHQASVSMTELVPQVKMLVANGVAGLSYDKVSVIHIAVSAPQNDPSAYAERELQYFLGMWIHQDSIAQVQWMLFVMLFLFVAFSGTVGYLIWSRRHQIYTLTSSTKTKLS